MNLKINLAIPEEYPMNYSFFVACSDRMLTDRCLRKYYRQICKYLFRYKITAKTKENLNVQNKDVTSE